MSSVLSAELAATCSALGYYDAKSNKYYADENTLETVKDLIRYLRRDDESHDVRRHLGETKIVETDLLPLLRSYWEEAELFDVLLRLLVNLTTPALMLWNEELPAEKSGRHHYLQIQDHLMRNKEAFADETVWAALSSRLSRILEIDPAERGDENSLIIERILILIRNILYVPPDPNLEKRPDNDASIHDQVLWALHQSGMLDIILYISSSANEKAYYMHTLEILSFMLREQKASELAQAALQRSETEKLRDEAELLAIRHGETYRKKQKAKTYNATRHSRFGGAYTIKSLKSINDDNDLIFLKPLSQLDSLTFDGDKKKSKTPKNRRPVQGATFERRSAFSIRLFLKEFCVEFVNGAYNTLMHHVKDNLVRQKAQDHDESYYLWALRFFMEFNRCYKFQVKLVSGANILAVFHIPSPSHQILGRALLKTLAERGHNVTMISPYPSKEKIANYRDVVPEGLLPYRDGAITGIMMNENRSIIAKSFQVMDLFEDLAEAVLGSKEVEELKRERFDLVILYATWSYSLLGLADHFEAPVIAFSTRGPSMLTNDINGNPLPPSYVPIADGSDCSTFLQRAANTLMYLYAPLANAYARHFQRQQLRRHFPDAPPLEDLMRNVSLVFVNSHYSIETPRPFVPNTIAIGGFHVSKAKELPSDLKKYLDGAKDGAILFSLGSNVQIATMDKGKLGAILKVFGKLKQKILFKSEVDVVDAPENVRVEQWLPQSDILAHPNLKLFISHGGLLSTTEAVYRGVPILGMPMFGDQEANIALAVAAGYAVQLNPEDITEATFSGAVKEIMNKNETMSIQSFHFVQQQMEHHYDMIASDKKKCVLWSRRLHLALLAYRELLMSICAMDKSGDAGVRESAKVIKSNIFYVVEYRELVITLLVMYDELKMSNAYLKDLIETQHVFVKMLESFCGGGGSGNSLIVQKKSRGGKKKRKAAAATAPQDPSSQEDLNLESRWDDDVAPQLSGILEGNIDFHGEENVVVPFDAASDVPIDEQRSDAMKNVQRKLRDGEFENAVSLLRAAREVWPENDCFGSSNMTPEEEFMALRDIFFANLGVDCDRPTSVQEQPIYGDDDEEEDEDDPHTVNYSEADFDFKDFCARLTNPKIVRACGLALQTFDTNSVNTNHCIVKLLHRVAFDCKMYVMLFQVSMFRSFQKIYARKEFPQYKELVKFATYVVRQFIKVAETNKKVYIEALFWKNNKEAYDIEHGYGKYQEQHQKGAGAAWSEEQEDELRRLFMEHRENRVQDDVVDWIVNNLIDNTRSRRAVLKKLKEMCLVVAPVGGGNPRGTSSRSWGAEEETQLRELFEQFKDATDPMACIMDGLEVRRSKARILDKLMVMGLIQDKKEMRKKRVRGTAAAGKSRRRRSGSSDGGSTATDSGSDSDGGVSSRRTNPSTTAKPKKKPARPSAKKSGATPANNKSRQAFTQASKRRMVELVLKVIASEMSEALEWLKECFEDAVEDFDPEVSGIPLVPILDSSIEAMDKPEFHELLKAVGVCEPFDEQETYWRIPGDIPLQNLKDTLELLKKGVDDQLTLDDEPKEPQLVASGSEDDDYVFNSLRTGSSVPTQQDLANSGGIPIEQNPDSDEDQPNSDGQRSDQEESQEQPQKRKQKKKRVQMLESDDETQLVIDLDEAESNTQESGTETQLEETEAQLEETETQLEESETQLDKTQADMSPNERGKNNKKRILDSDGEEEEEQDESTSWNVKQKKTRHILDSSDEEEESGKRGNATENSSPPAKRGKYVLSDDDDD